MVHGLRPRLGSCSIPVMMVPYCMIHFQKPLPETLGAIVAGLVLGFMSLRTRSIILGAAIHVSVALSMDFASLWRQGFFD
jgi:membrane protease YdiL (CAAX protease family)